MPKPGPEGFQIPRGARFELLGVLLFAALMTSVFWLTNLDLQAAAAFGAPPEIENGAWTWPQEDRVPWSFFYIAAPAMTGILGFSGLALMVAGTIRPALRKWRLQGLFLLLVVILGPGLIVNAIFKDHWGRPRPREVVEFGGDRQYLPPLQPGEHGVGKSFPCGHCSVAFAYAAFWFLLRARRKTPAWAWLILAGSLALGVLVGLARMAAGAHFLSDALWAGVFIYLTAWVLYFPVMKLPWRLNAPPDALPPSCKQRPALLLALYALIAAALLGGLLLATPLTRDLEYTREKAGDDPTVIHVDIDHAQVILRLVEADAPAFALQGAIRGFGFPTNTVDIDRGYEKEEGIPTVRYALQRTGIYTEYTCRIDLTIGAGNLRSLHLKLGAGSQIRVIAPKALRDDARIHISLADPHNAPVLWETP